MPSDSLKNRPHLIVAHIKDWLANASLGDRRVILTTPLQYPDHSVLEQCRSLGMVYQDHGRYMLERIF